MAENMKLKCPKCQNVIEIKNGVDQVSLRCVSCSIYMEQVTPPPDLPLTVVNVKNNDPSPSGTEVRKVKWWVGIIGSILLLPKLSDTLTLLSHEHA